MDLSSVFIFGILGNIISVGVYFAPLPTFYRIYQKKTAEGFQSIPYLVALFSASLWLYYALLLHEDNVLLVTINSYGCFIESAYILFYMAYATTEAKSLTMKILVAMNVAAFSLTEPSPANWRPKSRLCSLIVLTTYYLEKDEDGRVKVVGWISSAVSISVFVAPLGILCRVVRTKSVEFMPFALSAFLTGSAVIWFIYGLLRQDWFIAAPNILGFIFGLIQMVLYAIYRRNPRQGKESVPETVINMAAMRSPEVHPHDVQVAAGTNRA